MKINVHLHALLIFLCHAGHAFSQSTDYAQRISPFPIFDAAGTTVVNPFLGGLNTPRPQFVDIDADGDPDLFLQETGNKLIFFENTGSASDAEFTWRSEFYQQLDIGAWFKFVDADADGDADLWCESPGALMRLYRNEDGIFTLAADSLADADGVPIQTDLVSIPELADIDCDGDADLFLGLQTGGIAYFENTGLDSGDLPVYNHVTDQFQNIQIVGVGKRIAAQQQSERHGANAIAIYDIDGDTAPDIFWGDFFWRSLYYLGNTGACQAPDLAITSTRFPLADTLVTGGFNVPRFTDIDGDGDPDMFAGVLGGAFISVFDLIHNFYAFENTGDAQNPVLLQRESRFLGGMDFGAQSVPALVDIDGDGDLDLFATNEADSANANGGRLHFFRNTSTGGTPEFRLESAFFQNIDNGFNPVPAFADIDLDGDLDMVLGEWRGRLTLYRNNGTRTNPVFEIDTALDGIDIGNNSYPAFFDEDGDGDMDLLVGEFSGNLNLIRNTSSNTQPVDVSFQVEETQYLNIDVGTYSAPVFVELPGRQDPDLYVGSGDGLLRRFENTGSGFGAGVVLDVPETARFAPALADWDADGDLDVIAGSERGGLAYFENLAISTGVSEGGRPASVPRSHVMIRNYPNPFNPETVIRYSVDGPAASGAELQALTISDVSGRIVRSWRIDAVPGAPSERQLTWDGRDAAGRTLPSGIYFARVRVGASSAVVKMVLVR